MSDKCEHLDSSFSLQPSALPLAARVAVAAPSGAQDMNAGSIAEFMVMPGGVHRCWFMQGDKPVRRTVEVDRAAAAALEAQLEAVNARGQQRAFFDFDHKDEAASAWPLAFVWRDSPAPGVYCRAEMSQAGADAIKGRNYRAFSPVFFVTQTDPAKVMCKEDAGLNFGSLVNDPAFHDIAPLWAKRAGTISARATAGAGDADNPVDSLTGGHETKDNMKEKLADLTAKLQKLDTELQGLRAANAAGNAEAAQQLTAKQAERKNVEQAIRIAELEEDNERKDDALRAQRGRAAQEAVAAAVKRGAIPAQDEPLQAKWMRLCADNAEMLDTLQAMPGNAALAAGSITREASATAGTTRLEAKEGAARVIQAYGALVAKNSGIRDLSFAGFQQKGEHAKQMGALYAREIAPRWNEFRDMPLMAADVSDANLGTLSGTLVAQRTLQLFKLAFPVISRVFTDFSDTPAQFRQTEATRIVVVPAVQSYNTAPDSTGRPLGWSTVSAAQTKDVLITLDEHVGVPIVFDANTLASTMRRLFDEQAPAAAYALAKYFVEKIYKLFTPANYNAYAQTNGAKVPVAYANYPVGIADFARSTLTKIAAIFNPNEVPINDRVALLTSNYFEQLATDPSLVTFFAGQQSPQIVTENRLPKLAGFEPIEAPNLTAPGVTPNLVGMVLHKAAVVAKTRLSNDYTQALPGASYGSVTTITDPDIGISVVLVQYVNHTGGYAEWRIQVMLGAAVGDNRGGLCITSQ
jgi:Skp family chaperone for outer membrane proteins